MSDRDIVRKALYDAIDWQESLADANREGSEEREYSLILAKEYRKLLKRRYGDDKTPMERAFENATTITLDDLIKKYS